MKKFGGEKLQKRVFLSTTIQISFKHTIVIQAKIIQSLQLKHITMKEEDLSLIKRYSIVEYLEKKALSPYAGHQLMRCTARHSGTKSIRVSRWTQRRTFG